MEDADLEPVSSGKLFGHCFDHAKGVVFWMGAAAFILFLLFGDLMGGLVMGTVISGACFVLNVVIPWLLMRNNLVTCKACTQLRHREAVTYWRTAKHCQGCAHPMNDENLKG